MFDENAEVDEWDTDEPTDFDPTEDEKHPLSTAAHAMGMGGLGETIDQAHKIMKENGQELDDYDGEEFDYENEPFSEDDENDPWKDDLMEDGEDEGLDGCPFGQMKDENDKCVPIEGGYDDSDFNYDDELDDFVPDMLEDSDVDMDELQEAIDDSVGISPDNIKIMMALLFAVFLCVVIPICIMFRR